jgi:multidrug transporter EmrE-like cation transporter
MARIFVPAISDDRVSGGKSASKTWQIMKIIDLMMILGYVLLNSFGALAIKSRLIRLGPVRLNSVSSIFIYFKELLKMPLSVIGVLAIIFSAFIWMTALSRIEISIAYPTATALNFLVVLIIGISLFGEKFSFYKLFGILLIIISLIFLSKK